MEQVATTILYDGNPQGLRKVELGNWQGRVIVVPRASLEAFKEKVDIEGQAGVYILFGGDTQAPDAYIGQTDNIYGRLYEHDRGREEAEWNVALVYLGNLDSTSIRYLESVAVDLAKKAGRYNISNGTIPKGGRYNEAQKIKADGFFERMKLVTGLLGFPIFENPHETRDKETYVFEDVRNKDGLGKGTLLQTGEFIVFKDSLVRIEEKPGLGPGGRALRKRLIDEGILKAYNDKSYIFVKDHIFTSPSAASDTVAGRSTNGWVCWKNNEGKTLDETKRNN